jgi:nitrite reductase/ring-hydroxylating ferredoxin subunit
MTDLVTSQEDARSPAGHGGCIGCEIQDRRGFVREAMAAAFTVLGALRGRSAAGSEDAASMPIRWITAIVHGAGGTTYAIPAADGVQIDRDNQVILVRWQGAIYAFNLSCPHQNTALRWDDADARFQCPKHHSKYQPDGTFISGRATRNMDRLNLRRDGNTVVVDTDTMHKSSDDQAGWAAAVIHL